MLEQGEKKTTLENPGAVEYMAELGGEKSGVPFYAMLDAAGKKLADANALPGGKNIGYPGTPEEIAAFDSILKKTAPEMSAEQRGQLIEHLKAAAPR